MAICFVGCGGDEAAQDAPTNGPVAQQESTAPATPFVPPTASIDGSSVSNSNANSTAMLNGVPPAVEAAPSDANDFNEAVDSGPVEIANLKVGTPEWNVREIARLRTSPMNMVQEPNPQDPKNPKIVKLNAEQTAKERNRRQYKIIELAQQVVGKTHDQEEQESLFNNAVHYMSDARLQLALAGDTEQAGLMSEDADALFQRDATSFAAVESAYKIVQLTQSQAQRSAASDPKWAVAFAKQSRLFAERFPLETGRVGVNLMAAGRMCDNLGLTEESMKCLSLVEERLADTPFADQVAPILRRQRLTGQPLSEFGGSTHDGGYITIEQYRGKAVLIAFWASNSAHFKRDLPTIEQALSTHGDKAVAIGVNLDKNEFAVDQFLEETENGWKHIFYSDVEKRGARNLVAQYYGVFKVPTYWLITPDGTVHSVNVNIATLPEELSRLVK